MSANRDGGDDTTDGGSTGVTQRLVPEAIRSRFVVKFSIVLLTMGLAVGSIGAVGTIWLTDEIEKDVLSDQATIANSEANTLERWHEQNNLQTDRIASNSIVRTGDADRIHNEYFDGLLSAIPTETAAVHYADAERDEILATTNEEVRGKSIEALGIPTPQKAYERATPTVSWHSKAYMAEIGFQKIPVITYARQVLAQENRVILYTVPLESFTSEFQTTGSNSGTTLVIDADGHVVLDDRDFGREDTAFAASYDRPSRMKSFDSLIFPDSARVDSPPLAELGQEVYDFEDREYVVGYAPVEGTDWTLVIYEPVNGPFGFVQRVQLYGTIATLLAIGVVLVLGILLGRNTIGAINRLTNRARTMTEGDLTVDLETNRSDEIGELYQAFASMREAIQRRIEALEEARQTEKKMRKELAETTRNLEDQQLIVSVLNRLLRHNLRNSLTKVLLRSEELSDETSGELAEKITHIKNEAEQLRRQTEKSRAVEKVFATDPEKLGIVDVTTVVSQTLDVYTAEYPDSTVEMELPESAYVKGGKGVSFVVDNLVENALEHNDQDEPQAWVTVETVTEDGKQWVEVVVEDDGPGIPEMEIEVLEKEEETPLEHGSGIGLWLINWLAGHLDGELTFDEREPRGTTVTVRFPEHESPEESQSRAATRS